MSLASGTRLGPYEVLGLIGAGGMGEVYKARDTRLDRTVAIKVLPPELSTDAKRRARFEREAKTIAGLSHPHICTLHDVGEHRGSTYLVMEHLEGETLADRLRRGPLPVAQALEFGAQIADALDAAHKHGVIHRDLKPGNVMLTANGARLLDFGLAKLHGPEAQAPMDASAPTVTESLTHVGEVLGTRPYMAPEQVEGRPTDARTDIWALGCVLYEMVTGRPAFRGDSAASLTAAILDREPESMTTAQPLTPSSLERIVARCLAKRAEDRWASSRDVAHELRWIARPAERGGAPRPGVSRVRKALLGAAALLTVAVGVVGVVTFWPNQAAVGGRTARVSLAVLPLADRSAGKDQGVWCEGIAETLIDSLMAVPSLEVRGRQSSFRFTADDEVGEVGRKLDVNHVLTGSLQRSGNRLRVAVRLIETASGRQLWTETFDGNAEQVFDIQDRIAGTVVSTLRVNVGGQDNARHTRRYTNDPAAYDLYLRARKVAANWMPDEQRLAIPILLEAVARDPEFVLPRVALAEIYADLYVSAGVVPRDEAHAQAKAALDGALAIDPDNARALAIRAMLRFDFDHDLAGARLDYERAVQLSPRDPDVLVAHSFFLTQRGRLGEALDESNLLVRIDPAVAQYYFYRGRLLYYLHRYDEANVDYDKALQLDPSHPATLEWRVLTDLALGRKDLAEDRIARFEGSDAQWAAAARAWLDATYGNRESARKYVDASGIGAFLMAINHAALEEREAALVSLARVADENRGILANAFLTHVFDRYRSDSEFVSLMQRSGFEFQPERGR